MPEHAGGDVLRRGGAEPGACYRFWSRSLLGSRGARPSRMNPEQPYRQAANTTPPARRSPWRVIAVAGGVALVKAKALLGALKLVSLGKFALTALSMLAMVWVEAVRNGLWFGVGFVFLILIHELGHGWAIKRAGFEAGWPVFIPFFGAMIALRGKPQNRDVEARIAYAGPIAGTAVSLLAAASRSSFASSVPSLIAVSNSSALMDSVSFT